MHIGYINNQYFDTLLKSTDCEGRKVERKEGRERGRKEGR
jgi:hypothetical protein